MEPRTIRVRPESDPVVLELKEAGGEDQRELVLLVWGVTGRMPALDLKTELVSAGGAVRFEVGNIVWEEPSADPDEPVRGLIELSGKGGEEGKEATARLRLVLSLDGAEVWRGEVGLIAAVNHVLPSWEALLEEYEALRPAWSADLRQAVADAGPCDSDKLKALYALVHERGRAGDDLAAVCLSGGGIRSATFNLGILQGLAKIGLIGRFDYLSSVSGGGYIASWLSGWMQRVGGLDRIASQLQGGQPDPARPEAPEISHLRQYSNYLTPKVGALSADTWTLASIVLRNLLLNLLVLVPLVAAMLALPLFAISRPPQWWDPGPDLLFWIGVVFGGFSLFSMSLLRASATSPKDTEAGDSPFLLLGLVPLLISAPFILLAVARYGERHPGHSLNTSEVIVRCLVWSIAVPIVAFVLSVPAQKPVMGRQRASLRTDLLALLGSGLVEAAVYVGVLKGLVPALLDTPGLFVILGPGLLFGPILLGKTLFIAFSSVIEGSRYPSDLGDADREWWARWSGWVMLSALLWMGGSALVLYAPFLLDETFDKISAAIAAGGLGAVTSFLGKSGTTSAKGEEGKKGSGWRGVALALAAPLFCLTLLLLISAGTQQLLRSLPQEWTGSVGPATQHFRGDAMTVLAAIAVLAGIGSFMGMFVNVNRFSLQAMYRNRLVRAYLGASNRHRRPNRFTGFDPADNLRMHWLRDNRPLPVVNMALNLVSGQDLAWQQRRAESFTATPFHCGSGRLGYRRSQMYGGGGGGISLGTAVATSGAAANPNMGYHSSPAIGFIMSIFNARLGIWLGNPGLEGRKTYTRSAPGNSARLALAEAFGKTDGQHPYVNLSDGGHFENLGLYEMVRRRCRFIVVCDAGNDPTCAFDDLGNVIRKVRVDFGISIEFERNINIFPKPATRAEETARYCAVGRIRYDAVDGDGRVGTLIYIKPSICHTESYDIYNYARSSKDFPHESTADQWFDETQFESYRALGRETLLTIAGSERQTTVERFTARAEEYILKGRQTPLPVSLPVVAAVEAPAAAPILPPPGSEGGAPTLPV